MKDLTLKCIVVDDSSLQRLSITKMIKNHPSLKFVNEFNNAIKAKEEILRSEIDLIFLDIEMPIMSGFDLLKGLTKIPALIVISGKTDYAFKAFDNNAVDYLHKPVTKERFDLAIQKASNFFLPKVEESDLEDGNNEFIMIKSGLKNYKILLKNIKYIEANGDYVNVRTLNGDYPVLSSLKDFNARLPSYFLRVHKSYVVNLKKVDTYSQNAIELCNISLPMSRTKRSQLTNFIAELPGH